MNYYEARELTVGGNPSGLFHFTQMRDKRIWPVGYCAGWREWTRESLTGKQHERVILDLLADQEIKRKFFESYHTDGHATREDANACYRLFLLDNRLTLNAGTTDRQQIRCDAADCNEWTQSHASVDHQDYWLCETHMNRETIETLFSVSAIISSW